MTVSSKDKDLHGQIEELLVHISQMQKDHASLADELQREREERQEDQRVVRTVVDRIKTTHNSTSRNHHGHKRGASLSQLLSVATGASSPTIPADVVTLVETLDAHFPADKAENRHSAAFETKAYLRESLARTKEQLNGEATRTHTLQRQLDERDQDVASLTETIRETRHRLQEAYSEKQRLEKAINNFRAEARKGSVPWSPADLSPESPMPSLSRSDTTDTMASTASGLREFKLNRAGSVKQQQIFAKRSSSLATQAVLATENHAPADNEALLLELVTAKTAEAVARQELEEVKGKMETLRKAMGGVAVVSPGSGGAVLGHKATPSEARLATPGAVVGGFWGWGKRSVSTPPQ